MKLLGIGNSFSDDSFDWWLYPILRELLGEDEEISVNNMFIGGCSIDTHVRNVKEDLAAYDYRADMGNDGVYVNTPESKLSTVVPSKEWDVITFQQCSGNSGMYETYAQLSYLLDYVRNINKKAKFYWNMTWAYEQRSTHPHFENYNKNQATMYESIVQCVQNLLKDYEGGFAGIVPVGTAIQNARSSEIGDNLTRDGYHLSYDFGRYIAALTWAAVLTGKDISNIEYAPYGVDAFRKRVAIRAVQAALKEPFKVTKVSGKE